MRKTSLIVLALILSICCLAGNEILGQNNDDARSSVSNLGGGKWRVVLSAKDRWFDTQIKVSRGTVIKAAATGFIVWAPPAGRDLFAVGANGMSSGVSPHGTRPPFDEDKHRFPMPEAGCGALIMRIAHTVSRIGERNSVEAYDSGTIQLMVNDDLLDDNSGSFNIIIDIPPTENQTGTNQLLFSSERDGNQEIYELDLATNGFTNLSQASAADGYPRCSPNGRKIAFATNRRGSWEIYSMNRDGEELRNLTEKRGEDGYIDWSPDGMELVFASTRDGARKNDLYIMRADGSGIKRLTYHSAEDVHPAWSPDGQKIAFATERNGNRQIYVMDRDGGNLIRLMNNSWYDDYPSWSPDGAQIVFASDRDSKSSNRLEIYSVNADGSGVKRITSNPGDDRHPASSPDGMLIAFASDREGNRDLYLIRPDGTGLKRVTSSPGNDEHPFWCRGSHGTELSESQAGQSKRSRNTNFSVQISNVDDLASVYVNGTKVSEVGYRSNGTVDITNMLNAGKNQVRLILQNFQEGFTYKFEIYRDDQPIFSDSCGEINRFGCRDSEQTGLVFDRTLTFEIRDDVYSFDHGVDVSPQENTESQYPVLEVERIGPGRTPAEKMYQFSVPTNQWAETSIKIKPNQEVAIHHFTSNERVSVNLGGRTDSRLQKPGSVLLLYTSTNCSTDRGVQAKFPYTCVQLNKPESVKFYAGQPVMVGIYIKDRQ